jgi:hypothetical protein
MTSKRASRDGRSKRIKHLPAKPLKADRSKRVKGDANIEVNYTKNSNRELPKG